MTSGYDIINMIYYINKTVENTEWPHSEFEIHSHFSFSSACHDAHA